MTLTQHLLILLFAVSALLVFFPIRKASANRTIFVVFYIALVSIVVTRPEGMPDYRSYYNAFLGYGGERFEPGFHVVRAVANALSEVFGSNVVWGFLLFAIASVGIKFKYLYDNSMCLWGSIVVLFSKILIVHDMIAIRAAIAASLFLFAINYWLKNDYKRTFLLIIASVMFHYSALVYALIFFVNPEKPRRNIYIGLLIVTHVLSYAGIHFNQFIASLMFTESLEQLYEMYEDSKSMNVFNLIQIGNVLICILFWLSNQKIQKLDYKGLLYLKLYTIGLCLIPMFSEMIAVAMRLSQLFIVVEILLLPIGFRAFFKDKRISHYVLVIYSMIMFYFGILSDYYWPTI